MTHFIQTEMDMHRTTTTRTTTRTKTTTTLNSIVTVVTMSGIDMEDINNQWTDAEMSCLLALWGESSEEAKLEGSYKNETIYQGITCQKGVSANLGCSVKEK